MKNLMCIIIVTVILVSAAMLFNKWQETENYPVYAPGTSELTAAQNEHMDRAIDHYIGSEEGLRHFDSISR